MTIVIISNKYLVYTSLYKEPHFSVVLSLYRRWTALYLLWTALVLRLVCIVISAARVARCAIQHSVNHVINHVINQTVTLIKTSNNDRI